MSKWVLKVGTVGAIATALVVVTACGPKKGGTDSAKANPRPNASSKDVGGPAPMGGQLSVNALKVSEKETSTIVRIEASGSPTDNYTVFKLTDPMRVVIDIQNSAMGEVGGPYKVGNGTVTDVSASYFEDEGNKVTRVMIGLEKIVEYTVSVDGNAIAVEIPREGAKPAVSEMGTATGGSSVAMAETSAPATPSETPLSMDTTLPPESVVAEATPAPAATPDAPLFSEPSSTPAPEPTMSVAEATPVPEPTMSVAEATPASTPESTLFSEATPAPTPLEMNSNPVSEPTMVAEPAATPKPKKGGKKTKEPKVAAAPMSSNGLVKMTALDWNNKDANKSRIVIKTAAPVQYEELAPENNTVVLELKGVRVPKSLERALDTSEFKSAVKLISTYQSGDNARVVVQLRENVNHTVTQDGNAFNFDFDRPSGMTGPEVSTAPVSSPATEVAASTAPTGSESPMFPEGQPKEPAAEPASEMGEMEAPAPAVMAAAPAPAPSNGYRPVETFFADPTFASANGRPMAASGSALAGLQSGSELENGVSKVYTGRKLNMDFKNADIHNVLRIIANVSKLNIIASDAVAGTITVRLINVPWDQALDIILQSKKLDMQRQGNIIRIDTLNAFTSEREERKKAKDGLSGLLPIHTLLIPVSYATAADMQSRITPFLSKEGKASVDDRTNTLLVQDHADQLQRIRELTRTLDTATPQVLIEARLVEARTSFTRTIGIQWGGAFNPNPTGLFFPNTVGVRGGNGGLGSGPRGTPDDNLAINLPGPSVSSIALFTGSLGGGLNLDARLGALETTNDIKVVSSPRIATLDNKPAKISQGARIPFLSASAQGTQTQFIDATLELNVTPHITSDKSIFMQVAVRNNRPGAIAVNGQPSIDIAEATTEILVKDSETAVIGGVFVVNKSEAATGLPGLYKIPFLGFLFRTTSRSEDRRELLVFMTPHIIARPAMASAK